MGERTLAELFVAVRPDTTHTGRELERDLGRMDTSGPGRKAGHAYGHAFSGAVKGVIGGLGATVAALGVGKVLRDSVVGFQAHQKVVAQTSAALKSTGNAAHTSVGAIGRLSDALERKSGVDGDVIQSGANMLATFCLEESAQALSRDRGWVSHSDLSAGDEILAYDPATGDALWESIESVHRFSVDSDEMVRWQSKQIDVLSTPTHRWWTVGGSGFDQRQRSLTTEEISGHQVKVKIGGGAPAGFADEPVLDDALVQLLGWVATEGWFDRYRDQTGRHKSRRDGPRLCGLCGERPARGKRGLARCEECASNPIQVGLTTPRTPVTAETSRVVGVSFSQSVTANPEKVARIEEMVRLLREQGHLIREYDAVAPYNGSTLRTWRLTGSLAARVRDLLSEKKLTPALLRLLTAKQASLLLETLILGDGHVNPAGGRSYIQKDRGQLDVVAMLAAMLGIRTTIGKRPDQIYFNSTDHAYGHQLHARREHYEGIAWCPHLRTGVWLARVRGRTFWTGNTNVQNRVGKGNDIFNRATSTVLDMSVALGQDAPSSAIQLGKALNDPVKGVTALQRVGVTFTKGQKDQIAAMQKAGNIAGAQKVVLAELNKEFGGSAAAQGKAAGAQGRLIVAWRQAQDTIGSALLPVINELQGALADRLPGAAEKAAGWIQQLDYGVHGLISAFQGEGVTSSGFVGFMEHVGVAALQAKYGVLALIEAYKGGGVTSNGFVGAMERIGVSLSHVRDWLATVDFHKLTEDAKAFIAAVRGTDVQQFGTQLSSIHAEHLGDAFHVAGAGIGFLADHIDLVIKAMPFLIAAFAAYKATQAAANIADVTSIPLKVAQVGANLVLARSIKSLAASQVESTGATVVNTAVTGASSAALTVSRAKVLAQTAAQLVAKGAALLWAGAQAVLNAVLTANPIGLVIAAVAALAIGIIYAYKHSETFRKIVDAAFHAVAAAGQWLWDKVLRPTFVFIIQAWLTVAGAIVNGAATAFGWVPGLGGKLKGAAKAFNKFRDDTNTALSGVHDRDVKVHVQLGAGDAVAGHGLATVRRLAAGAVLKRFAAGGENHIAQIARPGDLRLWAEPETGGEAYIPLAGSKRARSTKILSSVASSFGYGLVPMAAGGLRVSPQVHGKAKFDEALAAFDKRVGDFAQRVGDAVQKQLSGGRVVEFAKRYAGRIPYVWGGASPTGADCSGWISTLVNVAKGARNPWHRLFSTGTLPAGLFAPGPGRFNIGWFTGNPGHVAATINGYPTESRGGDGVVGGARSRGASQGIFNRHAHLIGFAGGGIRLPGDPPFDLLDRRGKHYRPGLLDALKDAQRFGVRSYDRGGTWPSGTLGVNTSGHTETVSTQVQQDALLEQVAALGEELRALRREVSGIGREVGAVMVKHGGAARR